MKKILFIVCLFYSLSTHAKIDCEDAGGHRFQGASGAYYCRAIPDKIVAMNWWSAWAWCDAVGGELFNLKDCSHGAYQNRMCPEVAGGSMPNANYWTQNADTTGKAVQYNWVHGALAYKDAISYIAKNKFGLPLCKLK
ncbi:MAG: hypothetical protein ACI4RJ_00660 [Alphaproteobacteria bacterium]